MKCPVCDKENQSMLCPSCGFDSSRDYERYPTFGSLGKVPAVSELRNQWQEKQEPDESLKPIESTTAKLEPTALVDQKRRPRPLAILIAAAFALTLGVGVWIGTGIGGNPDPSKPGESVQMQEPPETTTEPEQMVSLVGPWTTNVLRNDLFGDWTWEERNRIRTVTFLNTVSDAPGDSWDVSASGNNAVLAWTKPNDTWDDGYDVYIGAEGGVWAGESCKSLFSSFSNIEKINFNGHFHTDNVLDMSYMFHGINAATLDLSGFNTSNVRDMTGMFWSCLELTEVDLSSFDTSKTVNMDHMFDCCNSLTQLDLSSFNTGKVQDMSYMFNSCWKLKELNLSSFDMTSVQNTRSMFFNCPAGDDWQHLLV